MKKNLTMFESGTCFIIAMLAMTVLQTIFSLIFSNDAATFGGMPVRIWVVYFVNQAALIAATVVFIKVKKCDFLSVTKLSGKINIKQIALLPFICAFTIVAFLPLSNMFIELLKLLGFSGGVAVPPSDNPAVFLASLLIIGLIPAFGEELLLRGALLSGLKTRSPLFAVLISALIFSLMHANAYQTVYQFFFGIVLALVCIMSRSLIAPLALHFLNNAFSLTANSYIPALNNLDLGAYNYLVWTLCIVVGVPVLLLLLYTYFTVLPNRGGAVATQNTGAGAWSLTQYEGFSLYTTEQTAADMGVSAKRSKVLEFFGGFFGLFKKGGLKMFFSALEDQTSATADKKEALPVYIALGVVGFWWLVEFIRGFV
jgi:membrane protease YdiL (CAAX protease family)